MGGGASVYLSSKVFWWYFFRAVILKTGWQRSWSGNCKRKAYGDTTSVIVNGLYHLGRNFWHRRSLASGMIRYSLWTMTLSPTVKSSIFLPRSLYIACRACAAVSSSLAREMASHRTVNQCSVVDGGSRSERIDLLSPWIAKMWFRYKSAVPSAPVLDVVSIKWTYFVRRSTKASVNTALFHRVVLGRPIMRSILRLSQGRSGIRRDCKSLCLTLEDLPRWQSSQERTKFLTESPMRGQ